MKDISIVEGHLFKVKVIVYCNGFNSKWRKGFDGVVGCREGERGASKECNYEVLFYLLVFFIIDVGST